MGRRGFKNLRRKGSASKRRTGRVFIFAAGFIVFLAVTFYGILYVKKKTEETPPKRPSDFTSRIKEADTRVMSALFNLGVNVEDIESKKVLRKKGNLRGSLKILQSTFLKGLRKRGLNWHLKMLSHQCPISGGN